MDYIVTDGVVEVFPVFMPVGARFRRGWLWYVFSPFVAVGTGELMGGGG